MFYNNIAPTGLGLLLSL